MEDFNVAIHIGLGDIICCKSFFLSRPDRKINIQFNHQCFIYRGPGYSKFMTEVGKLTFVEPQFSFTSEQRGYPDRGWIELDKDGFKPSQMSLAHLWPEGNSIGSPYILINTKVRWLNTDRLVVICRKLSSILDSLSKNIKIVIIGEREVERNIEYSRETNNTTSLYKYVSTSKLIDLTIPKLGLTTPTLQQFRQDCKYMAEAEAAINLGSGGNTIMSASLCKKVINFSPNESPYFTPRESCEKICSAINPGYQSYDLDHFFSQVESLGQNL
jgi:hypothetical protein